MRHPISEADFEISAEKSSELQLACNKSPNSGSALVWVAQFKLRGHIKWSEIGPYGTQAEALEAAGRAVEFIVVSANKRQKSE